MIANKKKLIDYLNFMLPAAAAYPVGYYGTNKLMREKKERLMDVNRSLGIPEGQLITIEADRLSQKPRLKELLEKKAGVSDLFTNKRMRYAGSGVAMGTAIGVIHRLVMDELEKKNKNVTRREITKALIRDRLENPLSQ